MKKKYTNKKILIISNNVLSTQKNNGKTILSFIDQFPKNDIKQLYFSMEKPEIEGYEYFQLSDYDIIKGRFNIKKRGRVINTQVSIMESKNYQYTDPDNGKKIKINDYTRFIREVLWIGAWKSKKLTHWIEEFDPDVVFFVAGDSIFAYRIYNYIIHRYQKIKSIMYITDDYVISNNEDKMISA